jgi:hypothetical protein
MLPKVSLSNSSSDFVFIKSDFNEFLLFCKRIFGGGYAAQLLRHVPRGMRVGYSCWQAKLHLVEQWYPYSEPLFW